MPHLYMPHNCIVILLVLSKAIIPPSLALFLGSSPDKILRLHWTVLAELSTELSAGRAL